MPAIIKTKFLLICLMMWTGGAQAETSYSSWGVLNFELGQKIGVLKRSVDSNVKLPIDKLHKCFRNILPLNPVKYGQQEGSAYSQWIAFIGPEKKTIVINAIELLGGFLIYTPGEELLFAEIGQFKDQEMKILPEHKSLSETDKGVFYLSNKRFYIGNQNEVEQESENLKSISLVSPPITNLLLDELVRQFMNGLEEFFLHYQARLQESRQKLSYDYHGLLEISRLARCRTIYAGEDEYLQFIDGFLTRINPRWESLLAVADKNTPVSTPAPAQKGGTPDGE